MIKKIAIVVASGSGLRMGTETPKQFLLLRGKPIIIYTLEQFLAVPDCEIILVLSAFGLKLWPEIKRQFLPNAEINIVQGGETRFYSVKNAINSIKDVDALVCIHDGVRPFVDVSVISTSFSEAENFGTAVTYVDAKDSIRIINGNRNHSIERHLVKQIQTPQTFKLDILRKAYDLSFQEHFTDDASVVESLGNNIHLIPGSYKNIKITTPEDLKFAEQIIYSYEN